MSAAEQAPVVVVVVLVLPVVVVVLAFVDFVVFADMSLVVVVVALLRVVSSGSVAFLIVFANFALVSAATDVLLVPRSSVVATDVVVLGPCSVVATDSAVAPVVAAVADRRCSSEAPRYLPPDGNRATCTSDSSAAGPFVPSASPAISSPRRFARSSGGIPSVRSPCDFVSASMQPPAWRC